MIPGNSVFIEIEDGATLFVIVSMVTGKTSIDISAIIKDKGYINNRIHLFSWKIV